MFDISKNIEYSYYCRYFDIKYSSDIMKMKRDYVQMCTLDVHNMKAQGAATPWAFVLFWSVDMRKCSATFVRGCSTTFTRKKLIQIYLF